MNKRNLIRLVVVAGALAWFAWNHFRHEPAHAARLTMAPIPGNAREFTLGKLAFKACELTQPHSGATTSAFCAPFRVPENWDAPQGRKIDLKLALIRSDAEAADADLVVFLAGGPGQAAVESWPRIASAFAPLRRHHHILLLDQRGTGGSHPLTCKQDDRKARSATRANRSTRRRARRVRRSTRECLAEVEKKADPRHYTTTAAAHDLEAVRQALGAPQFDLVGVSYGTRMAQQYLMRHPDGVRSVVLDSVVPNELVLGEDFAENLENALKAQFALCTKTPACAKAFRRSVRQPDQAARRIARASRKIYDFRDPITFQPRHKRARRLHAGRSGAPVRLRARDRRAAAAVDRRGAQGQLHAAGRPDAAADRRPVGTAATTACRSR